MHTNKKQKRNDSGSKQATIFESFARSKPLKVPLYSCLLNFLIFLWTWITPA